MAIGISFALLCVAVSASALIIICCHSHLRPWVNGELVALMMATMMLLLEIILHRIMSMMMLSMMMLMIMTMMMSIMMIRT